MKRYITRILHSILAALLLITMLAVPAAAQEQEEIIAPDTNTETGTDTEVEAEAEAYTPAAVYYPGDTKLGHTWAEVVQITGSEAGGSFDAEANSSIENKTLSDGTSYMEGVTKNIPQGDASLDQYVYLVNDRVVACVTKARIPDSFDEAQVNERMKLFGAALPVDVAALNPNMAEMVSDQMQIQAGMSSWKGKGFTAIGVVDMDARVLTFTLLSDPTQSAEIKMQGLTGTENLTPEEKAQVNTYIDFLQAQTVKQVNEFIAFLNSQKTDSGQ